MGQPYDGGCVCGAVRYRLCAEPLTLYACHCTDCQTHSGASFALSMFVPRDALVVTRGEAARYDIVVPNGPRRCGRFCAACATRLWGEPTRFEALAVLRPGTLDDTSWFAPVAHIWTRSAQPWFPFPEGAVKFERGVPDPGELLRLWAEREGA